MPDSRVSVVICTRNRAAALRRAFDYWTDVRATIPWELILVDNGSTDGTQDAIHSFVSSTSIACRPVFEPRRGLSRARNSGWLVADGQVVAFTDDDCYPEPDYVTALWAAFADPQTGYLGGRVLLHEPGDLAVTVQNREGRIEIPPGTFIRAGFIHGANMAARKTVLQAVGGFDEMLGAGTPFPAEDVDFLSRASAAGFHGAYDSRLVVRHHHGRRKAEDLRRLHRSYSFGRGAYYAKGLLDPARRLAMARGRLAIFREQRQHTRHLWRPNPATFFELIGGLRYVSRLIFSRFF